MYFNIDKKKIEYEINVYCSNYVNYINKFKYIN